MLRREEALERIAGAEPFDVLVVGGGITGAGVAREAARRGLRVALVDRGDIACGTSSRSSKLVHGGLRYLEQRAFGLVFESVSERRVLQTIAPHLVRPLAFLLPVYRSSQYGLLTTRMGLWLYDALSLFRSPRLHRGMRAAATARAEPLLRQAELRGAVVYYDCATDDGRLTLETAIDAAQSGAVIATYAEVTGLTEEAGRVTGARLRDRLTGAELPVAARVVLNATGPWTDRLRAARPLLRPTKGIHIVVPRERLPLEHAILVIHPDDGRAMFAIPWGDAAYIGTTDTDFEGDPAAVHADRRDIDYCLEAAAHFFPEAGLTDADIVSTWAGVRPLLSAEGQPSSVSREHAVVIDPNGLISIAGGKLTTYRTMAIDGVDAVVQALRAAGGAPALRKARTDRAPLPGGRGWPADDAAERLAEEVEAAAAGGLTAAAARNLTDTYGGRALELARRVAAQPALGEPLIEGRPEVWAQVEWAVEEELAQTVVDVLARRTTVLLRSRCQGLTVAEAVAARMGELLGWDAERRQSEVDAYRAEVAETRRWQAAPAATA